MFDYKPIEALAAVVQEGGFDKAAKALFITQSAVSQRVKLLEEQTGQILVSRGTPPRPTQAGRRILKHYLQVKRLEEDLQGEMAEKAHEGFTSLALGINADSLATWFFEAIRPFLVEKKVLLDLHVDDQEQTHRLLKDGEVLGCVSTQEQPMQGCRIAYLGCMNYRLLAAPEFAARWFPKGLNMADARLAPALVFNRKDELHNKFFLKALGEVPAPLPAHYVPSSERFVDFIASGLTYGLVPDQQSSPSMLSGRMVDLAPDCHMPVKLYWHCWNLESSMLDSLTQYLIKGARELLDE